MNIATVNVHVTLAADPKTGEIVFKFSGESKLVGSDGSIDLVNFKKNEAVEIRFQLLTQQITSRVGTVTKSRRVTFSLPGKKNSAKSLIIYKSDVNDCKDVINGPVATGTVFTTRNLEFTNPIDRILNILTITFNYRDGLNYYYDIAVGLIDDDDHTIIPVRSDPRIKNTGSDPLFPPIS